MKVLVTGSSGLIGSALSAALSAAGHEVVRLVRGPGGGGGGGAGAGTLRWQPGAATLDRRALRGVDAVVHLAGAGVADRRWTAARKRLIMDSRVRGTRLLAETLARAEAPRPRVWISASGVGIYGDRGEEELDEDSAVSGEGFLPEVARRWEEATAPASAAGVRVVMARLGMVLSSRGGALARMLVPFRMGFGGPVGDGGQYVSWVSIDDVAAAVLFLVCEGQAVEGPVNLVSPCPVTNREFARVLGRVLRRPARLRLPCFAVRALFGEMGVELLLSSTRALPRRLLDAGFAFRHADLETALRGVLGGGGGGGAISGGCAPVP